MFVQEAVAALIMAKQGVQINKQWSGQEYITHCANVKKKCLLNMVQLRVWKIKAKTCMHNITSKITSFINWLCALFANIFHVVVKVIYI